MIQRQGRIAFCQRARNEGIAVTVDVLDAPHELRRARVQQRNAEQGATFSMVVPDAMFELASDMWEAPKQARTAARRAKVLQ